MNHVFFAHFTGIPHHSETMTLWPLFVLMGELVVYILRARLRQARNWVVTQYRLRRGLADSAAGRVVDLGSFQDAE